MNFPPRRRPMIEVCEPRWLLSAAYHLTFDDEFNSLNLAPNSTSSGWLTANWNTSPYLNSEQEYYCLQNGPTFYDAYNPFRVANGVLSITAQPNKDAGNNPIVTTTANPRYTTDTQPYLSGMLTTSTGQTSNANNKFPGSLGFAQKYGYFEIRAQLPNTQGMWPAFWLMPADGSNTAEYDVLEVPINNYTVKETSQDIYQTVHWGGYSTSDPHKNAQSFDFNNGADTSTAFHTYGFAWTPARITWYVDGQPTQVQINRCDMPMYILLNLAIGGSWPGNADGTTVWPAKMDIDYVRVYSTDPNMPAATAQAGYAVSMPADVGTVDAAATTYSGILGGSFDPSFGTNGVDGTNDAVFNITGTPWTFSGLSGIIANGAPGGYHAPNAPDGAHAALLEQAGSFSQAFTAPSSASETYTLSFQAANGTSSSNAFSVSFDGTQIGTFNPAADNVFRSFTTASFTLTPGTHTVTFAGLNTGSGNRIAFIDDVLLNAATANGATLGTPTALSATPGAVEGTAVLNWTNAPGSTATGYQIARRTTATAGYAIIATVDASTSSFTDAALTTEPNTPGPIAYRVSAINSAYGVTSAPTNDATVTPAASPLAPPTMVSAKGDAGGITLTWINNSYYSTNIRIERKTGAGGTYSQIDSIGNKNVYTDVTAVPGTLYYYRVRAKGVIISGSPGSYTTTVTNSAYSGELSTLMPAAPTDIALSSSMVAENLPAATVVGALSATDPDAGDTFTFMLVSGTGSADNASFQVVGNQLQTAAVFNFEVRSSYSIRLRVADQTGLYCEKVFAISIGDVAEPLVINATSGNDVVVLTASGANLVVKINSVPASYPMAMQSSITINCLAGDDIVTFTGGMPAVTVFGGDGSDSIYGGSGNDYIDCGDGNDLVGGGPGRDTIIGGAGDDQLHGGKDNDSVDGGLGNDSLWGDMAEDVIRGGDGNDVVFRGNGNDAIWGDAGDDDLRGGQGNDLIYGGAGRDTLWGDAGSNSLDGGDDDDVIYARNGLADTVIGGAGSDQAQIDSLLDVRPLADVELLLA